jgi:hypothetical protein
MSRSDPRFVTGAAMGDLLRSDQLERLRAGLPWLGLGLVAVLSLAPLLLERPPVEPVAPYSSALVAWASKGVVLAAMFAAIGVAAWAAGAADRAALWVALPLVLMAGLMTARHWERIDRLDFQAGWQREMYYDILNQRREAPHQFRPLPYGFARSLEHVTGDRTFACLAYRWFFTYWFLWGCYRFARLWHPPVLSFLTLLPVGLLYQWSIKYYWGQLTDPLSHSLFVLAFLFAVRDRTALLGVLLVLGILAKETVILMVPAYWACYWRGGWRPLLKAVGLGLVCVAAFLAARLPYGWYPGYEKLNGTERLMVCDNLGIGEPYYTSLAPPWENYLHPALFVLPFVPFIAWGWRRLDGRLKALCLVLTPLLLLSNLCFGWLYESRNYMPLLPLLGTAALFALAPARQKSQNQGTSS